MKYLIILEFLTIENIDEIFSRILVSNLLGALIDWKGCD